MKKLNYKILSISLVTYSFVMAFTLSFVRNHSITSKLIDANVEALSTGSEGGYSQKYASIEDITTPFYNMIYADNGEMKDSLTCYYHRISCDSPCAGYGTYCRGRKAADVHYSYNNYNCIISDWFKE
jgi:hypothetical protein